MVMISLVGDDDDNDDVCFLMRSRSFIIVSQKIVCRRNKMTKIPAPKMRMIHGYPEHSATNTSSGRVVWLVGWVRGFACLSVCLSSGQTQLPAASESRHVRESL